jgi:hypothetical protein
VWGDEVVHILSPLLIYYILTKVLEEHVVPYVSTLMTETAFSSETFVSIYNITRGCKPEDHDMNIQSRENQKMLLKFKLTWANANKRFYCKHYVHGKG